jgi:lipoprotein-anchoring transpeptidase ErfK/SrfK
MQTRPSSPVGATQPIREQRKTAPLYDAPHTVAAAPIRQARPAARPPVRPAPARRQKARGCSAWLVIAPLLVAAVMVLAVCGAVALGATLIYGGGVLPKVSVAGVNVGGLSQEAAAERLRTAWNTVILRDGEREWPINPALLGITMDADATARQAYAQGRGEGNAFRAIFGEVDVPPIISIDIVTAAVTLDDLAPRFEIPAVNAGVRLVNGQVVAAPAQEGRVLDVVAQIRRLEADVAGEVADGVIDLSMRRVIPTVTDATPMLTLASQLLIHPLQITAYDPIRDQRLIWTLPPEQWSLWLTTATNRAQLALALDDPALRNYLVAQQSTLSAPQHIKIDEAAAAVQNALAQGSTQSNIRIYHGDISHTVQPGQTLISIAWDYGLPYPWIQRANPGLGETLSVGQSIIIPSADNLFEFPPVPGKRIIVSMREQRVRVYENGNVRWDWPASTGISSSPTWPGVYQIISHEPNAYAANWNLWMPSFLGVYRPIPGQAFTNGFHGFPTRGGSQLLWTNSLGTRVTYGCILLSSENAALLYNWAENGVIVEIRA